MIDSNELLPLTGISFKAQHIQDILSSKPDVGWFEIHPENYMVDGGPRHVALSRLREQYALSFHGVSLSLAGAESVDAHQLKTLKELINRYQPIFVSDHLAWSKNGSHYYADLLPLPLSQEALKIVCENVERTQDALGRQIFIENPSNYVKFSQSEIPEPEFLQLIAKTTGCRLLLDVNNIYISAYNVGYDATAYLESIPEEMIGEIHLAGHATDEAGAEKILIDDHGSQVSDEVWCLYESLLARVGPQPTLLEWDTNVPELSLLVAEASKANAILQGHGPVSAYNAAVL